MSYSTQQGLQKEAANTVMAGPATGAADFPTERALVNADLPTSGVVAAAYTNANITVNAQGIITVAASGSGSLVKVAQTGITASQSGNLRSGGGALAAGTYRVTVYMVITNNPDPGTLDVSIGWNDGTAARTATNGTNGMPSDISTNALNFAQGSTIVELDGSHDLTYALTLI